MIQSLASVDFQQYNEAVHGSDSHIHVDQNIGFEKERTISRLIEMQSDSYWSTPPEVIVGDRH